MLLRGCAPRPLLRAGGNIQATSSRAVLPRTFAEVTTPIEHQPPPQRQQPSPNQHALPPVQGIRVVRNRVQHPSSTSSSQKATEGYSVIRTHLRSLPVYQGSKAGGNLKLTTVRRVKGNADTLRAQLEQVLQPTPKYVQVNGLTNHVVVKGWYKDQVQKFLEAKGF